MHGLQNMIWMTLIHLILFLMFVLSSLHSNQIHLSVFTSKFHIGKHKESTLLIRNSYKVLLGKVRKVSFSHHNVPLLYFYMRL